MRIRRVINKRTQGQKSGKRKTKRKHQRKKNQKRGLDWGYTFNKQNNTKVDIKIPVGCKNDRQDSKGERVFASVINDTVYEIY